MSNPIGRTCCRSRAGAGKTPQARVAGRHEAVLPTKSVRSALFGSNPAFTAAFAPTPVISTSLPRIRSTRPSGKWSRSSKPTSARRAPSLRCIRLFGLKREVTADQLAHWQHLLFDSCNMCGRCSLICPMGIDVAALIEQARHAMFEAGLAPQGAVSEGGAPARHGPAGTERRALPRPIAGIGRSSVSTIPLDKPEAEIMLCVPRTDIEHYPSAVAALARVMRHLGVSCTFRSDGLIAENYGYFAGGRNGSVRSAYG